MKLKGMTWGATFFICSLQKLDTNSGCPRFTTDIVSAEIRLDSKGWITAFGQACAYLLYLLPKKFGYKWWAKEIEKLWVSPFPAVSAVSHVSRSSAR
jgi:hypothetical protein